MDLGWLILFLPTLAGLVVCAYLYRKPDMSFYAASGAVALAFVLTLAVWQKVLPVPGVIPWFRLGDDDEVIAIRPNPRWLEALGWLLYGGISLHFFMGTVLKGMQYGLWCLVVSAGLGCLLLEPGYGWSCCWLVLGVAASGFSVVNSEDAAAERSCLLQSLIYMGMLGWLTRPPADLQPFGWIDFVLIVLGSVGLLPFRILGLERFPRSLSYLMLGLPFGSAVLESANVGWENAWLWGCGIIAVWILGWAMSLWRIWGFNLSRGGSHMGLAWWDVWILDGGLIRGAMMLFLVAGELLRLFQCGSVMIYCGLSIAGAGYLFFMEFSR